MRAHMPARDITTHFYNALLSCIGVCISTYIGIRYVHIVDCFNIYSMYYLLYYYIPRVNYDRIAIIRYFTQVVFRLQFIITGNNLILTRTLGTATLVRA